MDTNRRITLNFDGQGNLKVQDEDGKPVPPMQGKLGDLIGTDKVVEVGSIPYAKVQGSCFYWVYWGGWYKIPC